MPAAEVLVIGGGPAGIAAATQAANAGFKVDLVEQRSALGGAIYRQPAVGAVDLRPLPSLRGRWSRLAADFATSGARLRCSQVFLGVDASGAVMLDDRLSGVVLRCHPRVLILALGAVERIRPRPGWQTAGVMAVGGLQLLLKEGRVPQGRVLLAGSGPLLLSLAQQLCAVGAPPVAVIEAGNPLARPFAGLDLLRRGNLGDMAALLAPVVQRRFPWYRGCDVQSIEKGSQGGLVAKISGAGGPSRIHADMVALHDGLQPNAFGLPESSRFGPHILHAGDLREVAGAVAAEVDGRHAAQAAIALLRGQSLPPRPRVMARHRAMQQALARLFRPTAAPHLAELPDKTTLCRCEQRSIGDLRELLARDDSLSLREIRLNGRFAMGACQGRFCAANLTALLAELQPDNPAPSLTALTGVRWPIRPVLLGALAATDQDKTVKEADFQDRDSLG